MAAENSLAHDTDVVDSYAYLAPETTLPCGLSCPCLICSDMRRHMGARPLPTELECIARRMLVRWMVADEEGGA
jgi:hypothetical protein